MTPSVNAEGHGQWFGEAATQELPIGWPWLHEYASLVQIAHLAASTTIEIQFIQARIKNLSTQSSIPHISA